jgi:hypothetical protein
LRHPFPKEELLYVTERLLKETLKLDGNCRKILEPAIKELAKADAIIQALLEAALDLHSLLSGMVILQIGLVLPLEERTDGGKRRDGPRPREIADYTFNIGPVSIYSDASFDLLTELEAQAAGTNGMYHTYCRDLLGSMPGTAVLLSPMISDLEESAWMAAPGTKEDRYHESAARREILQEELEKYSWVMDEFEDIRYGIREILLAEELAAGLGPAGSSIDMRGAAALVREQEGRATLGSEISWERERFSEYFADISGATELATELHIKTLEAQAVASVPHLQETASILPSAMPPGGEEPSFISSVHRMEAYAIGGPAGRDQVREALPGQRIIEVPDLLPGKRALEREESTAASGLWEAIGRVYHEEDTFFWQETSSVPVAVKAASLSGLLPRSISMPAVSSKPASLSSILDVSNAFSSIYNISNAFESLSNLIGAASEIDGTIVELIKDSGGVGKLAAGSHASSLLLSEIASHAYSLEGISSGGSSTGISSEGVSKEGSSSGEGGAVAFMNIALSMMAAAGGLQRLRSSVAADVAAVPHPEAYQGPPAGTAPRAMDAILQVLSWPRSGEASRMGGDRTMHVQNSFNIVVNAHGRGDEDDLRDLGRKIGLILSEEIRRYGGMR